MAASSVGHALAMRVGDRDNVPGSGVDAIGMVPSRRRCFSSIRLVIFLVGWMLDA